MKLRTKFILYLIGHLLLVGGALALSVFLMANKCDCEQRKKNNIVHQQVSTNFNWFVEGGKYIWDKWKIK